MNILSLFDGCAMAYCALEKAGFTVDVIAHILRSI